MIVTAASSVGFAADISAKTKIDSGSLTAGFSPLPADMQAAASRDRQSSDRLASQPGAFSL
jgi:hypothetical protein